MKNFDRNWQICASQARANPPAGESIPFGFASRVLAGWLQSGKQPISLEQVWLRLTWRSLAIVAPALLLAAAFEVPHLADHKPLDPGIENTVAQLVWSL